MKNIVYILILTIIFSCSSSENELSEKEAYALINSYFLKDIADKDEKVVFNFSQLKYPEYFLEDFQPIETDESGMPIVEIGESFIFSQSSNKKWKSKSFNGISLVDYSNLNFKGDTITSMGITIIDYSYIDNKGDSISFGERFKKEYGTTLIHNVSFPVYNPKTKIAVIHDAPRNIGVMECGETDNWYVYEKQKDGWKSLKEFGIHNVDKILTQYYKNTSL